MRRFGPAFALAAFNLCAAPFLGELRTFLKTAYPGSFFQVLAAVLGLLLLVALGVGLARIRHRRVLRYAGLGAVVALIALQSLGFNRGLSDVDLVEKVHYLQYGLLAYLLYRAVRPESPAGLVAVLLAVTAAGAAEEWVQWLVPVRNGDVRDVWLNAWAGLCGLVFSLSVEPPATFRRCWPPGGIAAVLRLGAVAVLAVACFYCSAHLGYWVEAEGIGRFRSWHTGEELVRLKALRAASWAEDPPRKLAALGKEDRYLTEAGWHVHRRNEAVTEGDLYAAWKESLLLERYFAPFLDIPPLPGTGNYRLHPDQMKQIEEGRPRPDPHPYVSEALEARVATWIGKGPFRLGAGLLAAGLFGLSLRWRVKPGTGQGRRPT